MGDTEWKPERKNVAVDWDLASYDLIEGLNDEAGPTLGDIKQLENASLRLPTMFIEEDPKADPADLNEKLVRLAQLLQMGLDYQMFQADKVQDEYEVRLSLQRAMYLMTTSLNQLH
eukprot:7151898-Pyramimonas_sp.AAC.2